VLLMRRSALAIAPDYDPQAIGGSCSQHFKPGRSSSAGSAPSWLITV
jgi:hypothetical protein